MEFGIPSDIVKNIDFNSEARGKILEGVNKLADAVEVTLGSSGMCVVYEDNMGRPVITKDGVTVAKSVVLDDPVPNMGATMIKEAAENTVKEAGDGTTTSTVIARALLTSILQELNGEKDTFWSRLCEKVGLGRKEKISFRQLKKEIQSGLKKVYSYLDDIAEDVDNEILVDVATISCNGDEALGEIIGKAFGDVGRDGEVLIEDSETNETHSSVVDGVSWEEGYANKYFCTDFEKGVAELENPLILISRSEIPHLRKLLKVFQYIEKVSRPLLIVSPMDSKAVQALAANKMKGNIKTCVVNLPGFGKIKDDVINDLAMLTGAKVIDELIGDDMDLIDETFLGEAVKSVTDDKSTVLTIDEKPEGIEEHIEKVRKLIDEEQHGFIKKKQQERLAMLVGKVGVIYVGADSEVELKEKKDRVDDAVHATKAALVGGIVPGGGTALKDASKLLDSSIAGEKVLIEAITRPMAKIAENAHLPNLGIDAEEGLGLDAVLGVVVRMRNAGIIDPVVVTKTALKNAVSVALTIVSADAVVSNIRA